MKEFNGTPGDWSVMMDDDEIKIIQSKSLEKGPIWKTYVAICEEVQCREDANLIAAAPDLLEALQSILELQTRGYVVLGNKYTDMARAAISKALGEE